MRLDHRDPVPEALRGAIVALGNFDGFHLGHQAVVAKAVNWARAEGRPAIVATFDPHPVRHFAPHVPPFRLTTLDQRQELFLAAGARPCWCSISMARWRGWRRANSSPAC
jgi:riboflavin kinase / FMN adenylyltransferase